MMKIHTMNSIFNYFTSTKFPPTMNVKLDTKEKFTVITPLEAEITANMSEDLQILFNEQQKKEIPHVVLNMSQVRSIDASALQTVVSNQEAFYNNNNSFVICALNENICAVLEENDWLDTMNVTPTESEAWDIVQMEEMEREMMNDFDQE